MIAQTAQDITGRGHEAARGRPDAIVHCGFGFGMAMANMILESLDWDPPRFMSTAFENAWLNDLLWQAMLGWTGVDQYDEANTVGQGLLDEFNETYGRRPEYCVPVVNFDIANVLLRAVRRRPSADARRRPRRARTREDDSRRVGITGHLSCRSATGCTAAGSAPATSSRAGSIPTACTRISSLASADTRSSADVRSVIPVQEAVEARLRELGHDRLAGRPLGAEERRAERRHAGDHRHRRLGRRGRRAPIASP